MIAPGQLAHLLHEAWRAHDDDDGAARLGHPAKSLTLGRVRVHN